MDLKEVVDITQQTILNSAKFPYRTGYLHDNFIDNDLAIGGGIATFSVLSKPSVEYGKILENAPSIRYRLRKVRAGKFSYIRHENRHFRYIDRIIESEVLSAIESGIGVKRK